MAVNIGPNPAGGAELKKFQELLRTLFQYDCVDLDFGIYRILNYKRQQVEAFIIERLPRIVDGAFEQYTAVEREELEQKLNLLQQHIEESGRSLGQTPFDEKGILKEAFAGGKLGREYLQVLEKVQSIQVSEDLKARVYNDLFNFFSRYYEDGDFISRRRYGRSETYTIPYNGEEVLLHWANKDQYYIKSGEHFKTYRFRVAEYSVAFELQNASTEQNNNKGEKCYFVLLKEKPVVWDEKKKVLTIFFEYRSLTAEEKEQYGKTEQQKPQHKLNEEAVPRVLELIPEPALKHFLAKPVDNSYPLLFNHLIRYTRKNTSDFFIHKDLKGFLLRELDFFIKNEVLLLDELIAGREEILDRHVRRARVVRDIGEKIIDFLAQVEDFQKKLWEKKKLVISTEYCVTLYCIPEELWDEVLNNEAQIEEWRKLFALDELMEKQGLLNTGLNRNFLQAHSTLVVDTRHFSEDFKWCLLASFDDLEEALDGVLVKSENWQALNLLQEKYRERVKCIYIDPPYNTATSGFLYKNNYQHSSWLSMMWDRLSIAAKLLVSVGHLLCHIDENEFERLKLLFGHIGISDAGTVVWDKKNPMLGRKGIATQHEYVLWYTTADEPIYLRNINHRMILEKAKEIIAKYDGVTEEARREFANWIAACPGLSGGERAYRFLDDDGHVYQSASLAAPEPRTDPKFFVPLIHPVTRKPCPVPPNGWSRSPETMQQLLAANAIIFGEDQSVQPRRKIFLTQESRRQVSTVIQNAGRGKNDVDKLGLEFPYCHPVSLYVELVGAASPERESIVFDYFAGSGTTAHAVINLNREDGGQRRFILVEMADYFDTVLLPRIKKVAFTPEWRDGKPVRPATKEESERSPRIVKYLRLESYEDTLNNLELPREEEGQMALKTFSDEYLLKYMLEFETQGSPSLLNLERFKDPFAYRLKVQEGDEFVEQVVDLVETFNYLLGIDVKKMRTFDNKGRLYYAVLGEKKGKRIAIVWRPVKDMEENSDKLMGDKVFIEKTVLPVLLPNGEKPDRLFVNGACFAENAEVIEAEFKRLMFTGVV